MKRKRAHPDRMRPNLLNKIGVCSSLFKWLNQLTQMAQSDYSSGSISEYSCLRNPMQSNPYPDAAVCVTRYSRILNPMQSNP